ncbi:MAG: methyl-accepting chemotaxis protein [Elusimicrobiales bacterium]|nr:methyl-accepting chemotaxis protein [Elusimicrobiales bacterium]MCK5357350.1 methyl-accepting chemotaxis protein [Elusimicrobiales bacterium]MCK5582850.1 methyl-accepting chemotaxis protein [Elusimicrobiales bacterium]
MEQDKEKKSGQQFQRKTILIKKHLQYKYMMLIFLSVFVAFLIVGLDIMWTVSKFVSEHPMVHPLLDDIFSMAPLFMMKALMYLVIVIIVASVISHRMAGPIFKFEKSAKIIANGDLTHRVWLRKGDHLVDLKDNFNLMVESLHNAIKSDKIIIDGLRRELQEESSKVNDSELKNKLEQIADNLGKIFSSLKI